MTINVDGKEVEVELGDGFLVCPVEGSYSSFPESDCVPKHHEVEEKPIRKIRI